MKKFVVFIVAVVAVALFGCAAGFEETKGLPAIPPPPAGTAAELTTGTETRTRVWSPKILSDTYSGVVAEVVDAAVGAAGDTDTTHAYSKDDIHDYVAQHDGDYDGLPDGVEASAITDGMLNLTTPAIGTPTGNGSGLTNVNAATATASDSGDAAATWYPTIVDGATGAQAIQTDAGLSFNPNTNILTAAGGFSAGASATPTLRMKDSDATAGDDNYTLGINATDIGDGTEDIDITEQIQIAGVATTIRSVDADGHYQIGTTAMGLKLGTAGVLITNDGDGALTFLGQGDGSDEDLTMNLDDTADTVVFSSSTGVTTLNFGTLKLVTTGTLQAGFNTNTDADGMSQAEMTTAGVYGTMFWAGGAGTWNLPAIAAGMSLCVYSTTAAAVVINPDNADRIILNGTALADGDSITSASAAGDYICLLCDSANGWTTLGRSGAWTDTN